MISKSTLNCSHWWYLFTQNAAMISFCAGASNCERSMMQRHFLNLTDNFNGFDPEVP